MAESLSESDIEYCLLALYRRGNSYKDTAEHLKGTYLGDRSPNAARLKTWREGIHRDRYLNIAVSNAEDVEKEMLVRLRDVATRTGILQLEALEVLVQRIKSGDVTPDLVKQLSIISGVSIDKMLVLSGRPDRIVGHQNPDPIIQRLVEAGYMDVIDSTATELTLTDGEALTLADGPSDARGTSSTLASTEGTSAHVRERSGTEEPEQAKPKPAARKRRAKAS